MSNLTALFDKEAARFWALADANPAELDRPIRDDGWTARMILAHLATATAALVRSLKAQLAHGREAYLASVPGGAAFNLDSWNIEQAKAWDQRPVEEIRAAWNEVAATFHAFVAEVSAEQLGQRVLHPIGQEMTVEEYLSLVTYHLRMHRLEIQAGFEALA